MNVGAKYLIKTKSGTVEKYLSRIEGDFHYFVTKEKDINSSSLGWMYASKGTVHNLKNVIKEI